MKKRLFLIFTLLITFALSGNASALYLTGGDASSQAAATDILDIVFVFDTSGSMSDEISGTIAAMQSLIYSLDCDDCDVWVRATLMGITSTSYGLGESVTHYVTTYTEYSPTSNQSEDNGPAVLDMVNYYAWNDDSTADQDYYQAIVTVGDEGTQDGAWVNEADWLVADEANQAAVDAGIMVFSLIGTSPYSNYGDEADNMQDVFTAMAEGGTWVTDWGTYTLADTGGLAILTTSNTLETDLENIICTAGSGGTTTDPGDPVPEPATMILLGTGLAAAAGFSRKKTKK